jgi:predicted nuclease with TOPRIM domain
MAAMEEAVLQSLLTQHAAGIRAHFDEAIATMASKADMQRLEAKVDALEKRIGALEARIGALEVRVGALEARVDALATRIDALEARFDTAAAGMRHQFEVFSEGLQNQIGILAEAVMANNEKLDRLFNNLDERVTRLESERNLTH